MIERPDFKDIKVIINNSGLFPRILDIFTVFGVPLAFAKYIPINDNGKIKFIENENLFQNEDGKISISELLRFDSREVIGNFNIKDNESEDALIKAFYGNPLPEGGGDAGYPKIVEYFIEKGVDVNIRDKKGNNALLWASSKGYTNIVKLSLKRGAEINSKTKDGFTSLMLAINCGQKNSKDSN